MFPPCYIWLPFNEYIAHTTSWILNYLFDYKKIIIKNIRDLNLAIEIED